MYNFDPYNVLLAIAINIPVLLMTAFVLQGHILVMYQLMVYCITSVVRSLFLEKKETRMNLIAYIFK